MYKRLGKFGEINLRPIRYYEDVQADKRDGYHLGFMINLLPVICINNTSGSFHVRLAWLLWEFLYWKFKEAKIEYDLDGKATIKRKGFRYYIFFKWIWQRW